MGAKFFMCLMLMVLMVSPAYCAEWIVRVETGMEDGKRTPLQERLFGSKFGCCLANQVLDKDCYVQSYDGRVLLELFWIIFRL